MHDAPPGVIKEKNYPEIIPDIKLMSSQNSTSNSDKKTETKSPEEKSSEPPKKYKSKFNLLDQGRLMIIGTAEETTKNLIIIGNNPKYTYSKYSTKKN